MARIKLGSRSIPLPPNKLLRIGLGLVLCLAGILGIVLPVLGFWMLPLGLAVLATDIPVVRRWNRRATVAITRWWRTSRTAAPMRNFWNRIRGRSAEA